LKAKTAREESVSIQRLGQLWKTESSIALITPDNSAIREEQEPRFSAKQATKSAEWFLKIPPQAEAKLVEAPSELHLIQLWEGGCQRTSTMEGALGG
jgi:hypothetical protein